MEQFKPFQPENKKLPDTKENFVWKKVKDYAKIGALSLLLSSQGIESALAQEKDDKSDKKTKIENYKENAANSLKKIFEGMQVKGQTGKFNETPVRRFISPDKKTTTTVGYDKQEDKANWLIYDGKEGEMRLFDKGADGSVDRIVINKENLPNGQNQKMSENDLLTFSELDKIAEDAQVEFSLDPQNVKVYEVNYKDGNFSIFSVDFKNGETMELTGPDAEELISKVQGLYTESVENVAHEIGQ